MRHERRQSRETRSSALWGTGNRGASLGRTLSGASGGRGCSDALAVDARHLRAARGKLAGESKKLELEHSYLAPCSSTRRRAIRTRSSRVIVQTDETFDPGQREVSSEFAREEVGAVIADAEARPRRRRGDDGAGQVAEEARRSEARLTITPTTRRCTSARYSSTQLWPDEVGRREPSSGSDASAPASAADDRDRRLGHRQRLGPTSATACSRRSTSSTLPNSPGDGRGHGTFVGGIAAGAAPTATPAAAPQAKLVSLDVMDDHGVGAGRATSSRPAHWILANKNKYNIQVANFSLHSATASNFISTRSTRPSRSSGSTASSSSRPPATTARRRARAASRSRPATTRS